jgi:hypothetical protein
MPEVKPEAAPQETEVKSAPKKIEKKRFFKYKGKHKGLATFFIIVAVIGLGSVGLEYVVTAKTQDIAAQQIDANLNPQQIPTVILSMHPILYKFLTGRIDRVVITAQGFKMKYGLYVDIATIDLKGLKFDPVALAKTKQITAVKSVDSGTARIVLSEEAVNALVAERLPGGTIKLEKGAFRYVADMPYVLPGVKIDVLGDVTVMPDNTLRFKPKPGELEKLDIPQDIKDYLISALAVDYKLEDIPEGMELTSVVIDPGKLTVDAAITDLSFLSTGVTGVKD